MQIRIIIINHFNTPTVVYCGYLTLYLEFNSQLLDLNVEHASNK